MEKNFHLKCVFHMGQYIQLGAEFLLRCTSSGTPYKLRILDEVFYQRTIEIPFYCLASVLQPLLRFPWVFKNTELSANWDFRVATMVTNLIDYCFLAIKNEQKCVLKAILNNYKFVEDKQSQAINNHSLCHCEIKSDSYIRLLVFIAAYAADCRRKENVWLFNQPQFIMIWRANPRGIKRQIILLLLILVGNWKWRDVFFLAGSVYMAAN